MAALEGAHTIIFYFEFLILVLIIMEIIPTIEWVLPVPGYNKIIVKT